MAQVQLVPSTTSAWFEPITSYLCADGYYARRAEHVRSGFADDCRRGRWHGRVQRRPTAQRHSRLQDAANAAIAADARERQSRDDGAGRIANAKLAARSKRRRRSSALALGDPSGTGDARSAVLPVARRWPPAARLRPRVASYYPGTSAAYAASALHWAPGGELPQHRPRGYPEDPDRAMAV